MDAVGEKTTPNVKVDEGHPAAEETEQPASMGGRAYGGATWRAERKQAEN